MIINCNNELATNKLAQQLASNIQSPIIIYLSGELGAGKTTFARAFIRYFGFNMVKSPTYSIVESYINDKIKIHHFDLYRITDSIELEFIDIRGYLDELCLIEWAENAKDIIYKKDLIISMSAAVKKKITLTATSITGTKLLKCLK